MKSRREMLAAGAVALPALALSARTDAAGASTAGESCPPASGPMAQYLPNAVVITHENEKALFYDDLLRDKIVTINFIATRDSVAHEVTENLARVQQILGDRVGNDIFMYSLTTDPAHDTPAVLRAYAERHRVGPGWRFLTGEAAEMQALLGSIFADPRQHTGHGAMSPGCSRGLVRYGNLTTGTFGSFPASLRPENIAERFEWFGFRKEPASPSRGPRRKGAEA